MIKACTNLMKLLRANMDIISNTNERYIFLLISLMEKGKPKTTHIFPIPMFRGKFREGKKISEKYAQEVQLLIDELQQQNKSWRIYH
jgi:hypothetical protein